MKLFIYIRDAEKFLRGDFDFCFRISSDSPESVSKYAASHLHAGVVDVDIDIDAQTVRQHALEVIDAQADIVRGKLGEQLARIEARRQNLLAITHQADA